MVEDLNPSESGHDDDRHEAGKDEQEAVDQWGTGFNIDKGKLDIASGAFQAGKKIAHIKLITSPTMPSQKMVDEHNVCHIPYAPWCDCCVRARALDDKHRKSVVTKCKEFPVVTMDWCYLGQEGDPKTIPVLVVRDSKSKSTYAHATLGKGVIDHEYGVHTIKAVVDDINDMGFKRIILKTDQEPAAKALQRRVKEVWSGEVVTQNSPVGSSQSNGLAEEGVQEVEGQARTLKIALEGRLKVTIPTELPIMMWLVEQSGDLMNRFRVGKDGRTPRERNTGKEDTPLMAEFGEAVFY